MANGCGNLAEWPKINHENSRPDKGTAAPIRPGISLFPLCGEGLRCAHGAGAHFGGWLQPAAQLAGTGSRPAASFGSRARGIGPWLTRYHDATGTPVTIFFDGSGAPAGTPPQESNPAVEVLFSCAGQTADDMIERAAHRFSAYGEILAVTDDVAERDTVTGMGGLASSCANFIRMVENALTELQDELQNYNRAERNRFNRSHKRDLK